MRFCDRETACVEQCRICLLCMTGGATGPECGTGCCAFNTGGVSRIATEGLGMFVCDMNMLACALEHNIDVFK